MPADSLSSRECYGWGQDGEDGGGQAGGEQCSGQGGGEQCGGRRGVVVEEVDKVDEVGVGPHPHQALQRK